MIRGEHIDKSYGDHHLFREYNFLIRTGEFICFSGPSGAGKTTMLNMIGKIEKPDRGWIEYDGKTYNSRKELRYFYSRKIGFLFQNFALIDDKTVRYNLSLIQKKDRTSLSVKQVLEMLDLQNKIDRKVYTLSGGEQQRVALARLLLKQCDIVLADEPTGSLDRINSSNVMDIIDLLHKSGKTIVLVTHDPEIKERADRVIEL